MQVEQMTNEELARELKMLGTHIATGNYDVLEKHETAKVALLASQRIAQLEAQIAGMIERPVVEFIDDTLTVNGGWIICDEGYAMNVYDNLLKALGMEGGGDES